ncbi:MAG: M48 family metalloprotease [Acidobacteriaceae bacterium]|nr:M48 family metalloprotease [Acidobacteriaceae bacterium]
MHAAMPLPGGTTRKNRATLAFLLAFSSVFSRTTSAQTRTAFLDEPDVPPNFTLDVETGTRLRPQLLSQSLPATGRYTVGGSVFKELIQKPPAFGTRFAWELRIINNHQLNAYASPEGTIYVEGGLAQLAGQSTGLWAAILSHEITHIVRRDWARRYLYQKSMERDSTPTIVLGDPGLPFASWSDSQRASEDLARFCRKLELEADRESLMLMARAGYHPHFVPALHHLLHVNGSGTAHASLYAMHPCWEERDRELMRAYVSASIEFEHLWPRWYASPGGNPPIVIFVAKPTAKRTSSKEWEIQIPMRCENLVGAVEVVLRVSSLANAWHTIDEPARELRQLTGCTSQLTTITFILPAVPDQGKAIAHRADVSVFDAWGAPLARVELPKLSR